jgi:hypothetical protein
MTRLLRWFLAPLFLGLVMAGLAGSLSTTATTPTLYLVAPSAPHPITDMVTVEVRAANVSNLGAWEFDLRYDPAFLTLVDMRIAPGFGAEEKCTPERQRCAIALGPIVERAGRAEVGAITYGEPAGLTGEATIALLHLKPASRIGQTGLSLENALLADINAKPSTPAVRGATLTLAAASFGTEQRIYLPNVQK